MEQTLEKKIEDLLYDCSSGLCLENNFLHFAFYDATGNLVDHRLVRLGVENPCTKSATDEFWESYNSHASEDIDEWEEVTDSSELFNDCEDEDSLPF